MENTKDLLNKKRLNKNKKFHEKNRNKSNSEKEITNNSNKHESKNKKEDSKIEQLKKVEETNFFHDEITLREENKQPNSESKWKNRQRVLVVASRGVTHSERILMNNIISLLPHAKKECKIERDVAIDELNEICFNHSCTNCVYFEHKKKEFVMWIFRSPDGPTLKFQVNNIHSLDEPKMAGNCLKHSRPILNFDSSFNDSNEPYLQLIKEMFVHVFNTPKNHPKSKPFYDHITSFMNFNNNIYFRNYQIVNDLKEKFLNSDDTDKLQLVEIGPRFSLKLIKIFDGILGGKCLYTNPNYVSPGDIIRRNANSFKDRQLKLEIEQRELEVKTKDPVDAQTKWIFGK
jgi:ribosome biogenesis protein BRX1